MTTISFPRVLKTPRRQLRDNDSTVSVRPRVLRLKDVPSSDANFFDDRNMIIFRSGTQVHFPTMQETGSHFISDASLEMQQATTPGYLGVSKQYPAYGGGIFATGSVTKGASDSYLYQIPGSPLLNSQAGNVIDPFTELHLHSIASASFDDPFYSTGSRPIDVGLGLSQPVWAKARIEIPLDVIDSTTFGYTTQASSAAPKPSYSPMVYYDFHKKKWQRIGHDFIAAGFTSNSEVEQWLQNAPIGFTRGTQLSITGSKFACFPCSNFGFPVHPKFHATASHLLSLTSSIQKPFLIEKFSYEFDAEYSLGFASASNADKMMTYDGGGDGGFMNPPPGSGFVNTENAASIATFFILNQRRPFSVNEAFTTLSMGSSFFVTASIPANVLLTGSNNLRVNDTRELVSFAQVLAYSGSRNPEQVGGMTMQELLDAGLSRELNIDVGDEKGVVVYTDSNTGWSRRRLILSGTIKQAQRLEQQFGWRVLINDPTGPGAVYVFLTGANVPGGRTNIEMHRSGRDFNASQPGGKLENEMQLDVGSAAFYPPAEVPTVNSPYLLMPGDQLVFGWQIPHLDSHELISGSAFSFNPHTGPQMTMHAGPGKLVLYGSMLQWNQEYQDGLNQRLTNDSVYEPVTYGETVLDQYDTAPRELLSGSYVDNFITGTMTNGSDSRKVLGSIIQSGSFDFKASDRISDRLLPAWTQKQTIRNPRFVASGERIYDTMLPAIHELFLASGGKIGIDSAGSLALANGLILVFDDPGQFSSIANFTWTSAFPFEPQFSNLNRRLDSFEGAHATHEYTTPAPLALDKPIFSNKLFPIFSNATNAIEVVADLDPTGNVLLKTRQGDLLMSFFGFTNRNLSYATASTGIVSGSRHIAHFRLKLSSYAIGPEISGWKYGIYNAFATNSSIVFRRDSYGQFRDMLEQRIDTKFHVSKASNGRLNLPDKTVDPAAVQVVFRTYDGKSVKGNRTWSSNLSVEATSSLPYFDGIVRNRENPLDMSLIENGLFT